MPMQCLECGFIAVEDKTVVWTVWPKKRLPVLAGLELPKTQAEQERQSHAGKSSPDCSLASSPGVRPVIFTAAYFMGIAAIFTFGNAQ